MTEQLNVQQMAEKLLAADNILILCHKNPDGDTVGCGSALYYALLALEKHAAVLCADPIPGRYAFTNPRLFKGEFEPQIVVAVVVVFHTPPLPDVITITLPVIISPYFRML